MKKRLILSIFLLGAGFVLASCNNDRNKVESTTVETTTDGIETKTTTTLETTTKPQETTTETTTETATEATTKTIVETTTETTTEPEETSSLADLPWVQES